MTSSQQVELLESINMAVQSAPKSSPDQALTYAELGYILKEAVFNVRMAAAKTGAA